MRAFAELVGVSHEVIRKWELGITEPTASELARIATVTRHRIEYFFTEARTSRP